MKKLIAKMSVLLAGVMLVCATLTGCGLFGGGDDNSTPKEYVIQYSDDVGTHTLTVTEGMPFALESVPYKYGYEFTGLFDAQTGGTQYVGANGASLAPYNDKENKVLFPQFKPIDYTVILDYGEAKITGERSLTVPYGANFPELPKDLTLAHNEFTGWYTEAGGQGTQIADAYGNLPVVSVLNEENFKLDESKRVYLYAGFELETYTVTFYFDEGMAAEEVEVPYNTPISRIVPKTRNDKKEAGLTWSKSRGGDVFTGNITEDMDLYVKDWAAVIELNGNGVDVTPIVAKAGTTISLPTPTKPLAKFLRWEDENGQAKDITVMPTESMTLNAVWQAKIEFDENGGSDVDDISKPAGEKITLPTPTKEGYLFAGWYTADKEQYTQTKMPSAGVALKAGWYKTKTKIYGNASSEGYTSWLSKNSEAKQSADWRQEWDLSELIPSTGARIHIKYINKVRLQEGDGGKIVLRQYYYDSNIIGDSYLLGYQGSEVNTTSSKEVVYEMDLNMKSNTLYIAWYAKNIGTASDRVYFNRVSLEITYPDTTQLYL